MITKKQNQKGKFQVGDTVMVRSRDDIIKSLDPTTKAIGDCLFTNQMWDYCGSKHKVVKVVRAIFNEHRQRTSKPKSTLYILDNLICNGIVDDFPHKCDHSCFLLWHENWLEEIK